MNIEISGAKSSPRYDNNIWKWYFGDTFTLLWRLIIKSNNIPISITNSDKVEFVFQQDLRTVHTFIFTNIDNNSCALDFSKQISSKFLPGDYTFCIKYIKDYGTVNERITTIGTAEENKVCVEACH